MESIKNGHILKIFGKRSNNESVSFIFLVSYMSMKINPKYIGNGQKSSNV